MQVVFFFQAEDGIRDLIVTGVQTCALPISVDRDALIRGPFVVTPSVPVLAAPGDEFEAGVTVANNVEGSGADAEVELRARSEERRVGKEGRSRWSPYH